MRVERGGKNITGNIFGEIRNMQNKMFNPTAQLDKAEKEEAIKTKEKSPNESRKDNEGTS